LGTIQEIKTIRNLQQEQQFTLYTRRIHWQHCCQIQLHSHYILEKSSMFSKLNDCVWKPLQLYLQENKNNNQGVAMAALCIAHFRSFIGGITTLHKMHQW